MKKQKITEGEQAFRWAVAYLLLALVVLLWTVASIAWSFIRGNT